MTALSLAELASLLIRPEFSLLRPEEPESSSLDFVFFFLFRFLFLFSW